MFSVILSEFSRLWCFLHFLKRPFRYLELVSFSRGMSLRYFLRVLLSSLLIAVSNFLFLIGIDPFVGIPPDSLFLEGDGLTLSLLVFYYDVSWIILFDLVLYRLTSDIPLQCVFEKALYFLCWELIGFLYLFSRGDFDGFLGENFFAPWL